MSDDALMQPITLPLVAITSMLAAAYMRGVNAGCLIGYDAHQATSATVDELMAACMQQALEGAQKDTQERATHES